MSWFELPVDNRKNNQIGASITNYILINNLSSISWLGHVVFEHSHVGIKKLITTQGRKKVHCVVAFRRSEGLENRKKLLPRQKNLLFLQNFPCKGVSCARKLSKRFKRFFGSNSLWSAEFSRIFPQRGAAAQSCPWQSSSRSERIFTAW